MLLLRLEHCRSSRTDSSTGPTTEWDSSLPSRFSIKRRATRPWLHCCWLIFRTQTLPQILLCLCAILWNYLLATLFMEELGECPTNSTVSVKLPFSFISSDLENGSSSSCFLLSFGSSSDNKRYFFFSLQQHVSNYIPIFFICVA